MDIISQPVSLDTLPILALLKILDYVTDVRDLCRFRMVNRRLYEFCTQYTRHVCGTGQYLVSTDLFNYYTGPATDKIITLDLNYCYWIQPSVSLLQQCVHLKSLHLLQVEIDASELCSILIHKPELNSLSFSIYDFFHLERLIRTSAEVQNCLSRLKSLALQFCNRVEPEMPSDFCETAPFFSICKNLEEIHIMSSFNAYNIQRNSEPLTIILNYFTPPKDCLTNMKVLSYSGDITLHRLIFLRIERELCMKGVQLKVLLRPPLYSYNEQDYEINTSQMTALSATGIMHAMELPNKTFTFQSVANLSYLNLCGNVAPCSRTLHLISACCPLLSSLNLHGCSSIYTSTAEDGNLLINDLTGLASLIDNCLLLQSLNISETRFHPKQNVNKYILTVLSVNKNWKALSISEECFISNKMLKLLREEFSSEARRSNTIFNFFKDKYINSPCDLKGFVECCQQMEQFETFKMFVDYSQNTYDYHITSISSWHRLKKLHIYGFLNLSAGHFLSALVEGCPELEHITIEADCVNIDWTSLVESERSFKKLRVLILAINEINEDLLVWIARCKKLQHLHLFTFYDYRLADGYIHWMIEQLPELINIALLINACSDDCLFLKQRIENKFWKHRPALNVWVGSRARKFTPRMYKELPYQSSMHSPQMCSQVCINPPDDYNEY